MERTRTIACAPARGTTQAWEVVSGLVTDTLTRSTDIEHEEVEAALSAASGVGRQLIAGGHLEKNCITLVAENLYLKIITVSGDDALTIEENLAPVPGAATACDWKLHLPPCDPLAAQVKAAAKTHVRLSAEPPAARSVEAAAATSAVDGDALRRWAREGT